MDTIGLISFFSGVALTLLLIFVVRVIKQKLEASVPVAGTKPPAIPEREDEKRHKFLAENINDLISEIDQHGCLCYASPNVKDLLGYDLEEVLGRNFAEFIHPDDVVHVRSRFETSMRNMTGGQVSYRCRHKQGDWIPMESAGKPFRSETGTVKLAIVSRDVTQRYLLENELLKTKKLESLSILAGGVAHDFNNILTAILMNISTAKMDMSESDEAYGLLDEAQNACLQAKELTEQLLTFSKRGVPMKKATSISHLIRDTVKFTLRGSNVICKFELAESLWTLEVDEVQISQVINNIVLNAVQAMPDGGCLTVQAENYVDDGLGGLPLAPGEYVRITFRDEGPGISAEQLSQIFDPYFTTRPEGSGLGLSTSYSIIKNHDGLITADSEPGAGTSVSCYLPAASHLEPPSIEKTTAELHTGSGRILVMDDDSFVRSSLVKILTRLGYEVEVTQNGDDAIVRYRQSFQTEERFDAVIVDLTVPGGKGGKETIRALRQIDPDVKAIVASGYLNNPVLKEFERHGFAGVLKKPFEIEEVSRKLYDIVVAHSSGKY